MDNFRMPPPELSADRQLPSKSYSVEDPSSAEIARLPSSLTQSEIIRVKHRRNAAIKRSRRFRRRVCNWIRDFDRFGTPIPLNYQGSDTFKTVPGSFLSLVAYIILIVGLLKSFRNVVNNKEWSLKQQNEILSFEELNQPVDLTKYPNFQVGFELKASEEADSLTREEYLEQGRFLMKFFTVNEIGYSKNSSGQSERKDKPQTNFVGIVDNKPKYYGHTHVQDPSDDLNSQNYLEYKIDLNNSILSGSESFHSDITNNYVTLLLMRDFSTYATEIEQRCLNNVTCLHILESDSFIFNEFASMYSCASSDVEPEVIKEQLAILKFAFTEPKLWVFFRFLYYTLFETVTAPKIDSDYCLQLGLKILSGGDCPTDNQQPETGELSSKCLFNFTKDKLDEELNGALKNIQIKPVVYDEITNFQDGKNEYPFQQRKAQSSAPKNKKLPFGKEQPENFKFTLRKAQVCMDDDIFAEFKVYNDEKLNKCNHEHDFEVVQMVNQNIEYLAEGDEELMMGITILMDNQIQKTEVRSYKFYDLLADNGGFFEALLGLFAFVGNPLSRISFRYSVARYAFYTRKSKKDLGRKYFEKNKQSYMREGLLDYAQMKLLFSKIKFSLQFYLVEPLFGCFICPCCKGLFKEKKIIDEANDKFEEELDVIGLVKRIRLSTDLWQQSLSLDQKKSLKFSRSNVVVQRETTPWMEKFKRKIDKYRMKQRSLDTEPKKKHHHKKKKRRVSSSSSPEADSMSFSISSRSSGSSSSEFEIMKKDLEKREGAIQDMNKTFTPAVLNSIPIPIYKPEDLAALENDLVMAKSNSQPSHHSEFDFSLPTKPPPAPKQDLFEKSLDSPQSQSLRTGLQFGTFLDVPESPAESKRKKRKEKLQALSQPRGPDSEESKRTHRGTVEAEVGLVPHNIPMPTLEKEVEMVPIPGKKRKRKKRREHAEEVLPSFPNKEEPQEGEDIERPEEQSEVLLAPNPNDEKYKTKGKRRKKKKEI